MPLWIWIVRRAGAVSLTILLIAQIAFDYWSSFSTSFNLFIYGLPDGSVLKPFLLYRLNYWVMHYLFIFILGGWLAVHISSFRKFMQNHSRSITLCFLASLSLLLTYYYYLIGCTGYTPMEAINTAHQLCPAGIFYTIAASIFFFTIFTEQPYPPFLNPILHQLGRHSYFAYLAHPVAITYLSLFLQHHGILMTAPAAILFYAATLFWLCLERSSSGTSASDSIGSISSPSVFIRKIDTVKRHRFPSPETVPFLLST